MTPRRFSSFYGDDGSLAWESDIVSGTPDGEHDTPEGVYVINGKESPSKLIGQMKPETGRAGIPDRGEGLDAVRRQLHRVS